MDTIDLEQTLHSALQADQNGDIDELAACLDVYYLARLEGIEEPRNGDVRADTLYDTLLLYMDR